MPTCSDYGSTRLFSFKGNGYFFCSACDLWDSLPADRNKKCSRTSRRYDCIQAQLTTAENRSGSLSISDLELAGTLAHKHVLAIALPSIAERPIWLTGDNRASLAWATKGSSTSTAARAYLLRLNALHQRHYRYVPQHSFIAGKANVMADDASRRWDLTDSALIAHFNSLYPQNTSWTMQTLPDEMRYAVIGSLSRRRWIPATLRIAKHPPQVPGASGNVSDLPSVVEPTCSTSLATLSRCSCSFPKVPHWRELLWTARLPPPNPFPLLKKKPMHLRRV